MHSCQCDFRCGKVGTLNESMQLDLPYFSLRGKIFDWLIGPLFSWHPSFEFSVDVKPRYIFSPTYFSILLFNNHSLIYLNMLSSCRIIARPAAIRSSLARSIALRSASAWAQVPRGPPVRPQAIDCC